ncbi:MULTISPECIES: metal ABC transporter ATP-binding protein [Arcobacteraceae]|uniref:High-affinity zinc uptake system ATP-binding protein ZnuC n=2 Tax=Aliarcobacter thereius TaxID=544718 RepID=A0A1C0B7Y1_9BACT|nr:MULTISPECIES: metal ABC transporter ATP-binding protein [Arcobacteraceae]OCL87761.1 High-affinity zinc uptake system ATP-binding protein ZnuC [Aliarcobacter thereius]OCL87938.1 High-affinity zinc uptake system ATP-binding protein ZnuC [Arcobacter porcinus]OCL94018.1 High-affinity zinc uptake system ATP-binding protein ZnuC [Aliarcobacter thereius]OCL95412.1 High-affinity zinc uptake system ATP-binding protein ZnuC [Aliarcobacter thereius LMG 24486]OCL99694.1 High-affinity zinc uptake system
MNLINIENLFFKYQKTDVLENINLKIRDDDFLAIIGPNGGGKSTLLKLILGLLTNYSGRIEKNIKTDEIGYVPQNTNLNMDFPITALEIVLMGHNSSKKRLFGYSKESISCAKKSLEQVGMLNHINSKIGDLSGGQRQRVFIARALCSKPKIMLLDEPTASIDVKGQQEIYELLKDLNKTICIVVVSHDLSILLNYAKDVAHINKSLVYHSLEELQKNVTLNDDHLCEVELLSALGKTQMCCNH